MSELSDERYTDEEKAYLESGGAIPAAAEPPKPEGQSAGDQPPSEPQEPDDDGSDADDVAAQSGEGSQRRKVNWNSYERVKKEAAETRKALEELRAAREAEARQFVDFRARAEERLRALQPQQRPAEPPRAPAPPPNLDEDPMAYIRWQGEQMAAMQQALDQTRQGFNQSAEQQRQVQAIAQLDHAYRSDNRAAAQEMPAYPSAYNFMVERAKQVIRIQNPNLSPAQIDQAVEMQERQLAAAALQRGQRPAAMIVQMAATYGWRPEEQGQAAPQQNPAADQARLDAARRGQEANRSLSGAGRSGATGEAMTLEKLLDMPNDEFAAWTSKNPEKYARMQGVN